MKRRASGPEPLHSGGMEANGRPPAAEILLVLVATLVLIVPFAGFLYDTREQGRVRDLAWDRVQKTRMLRVGMDFGIPPFAIPSGNDVQGFDADLARDLSARLGVGVVIVNTPSDALYDALLTG